MWPKGKNHHHRHHHHQTPILQTGKARHAMFREVSPRPPHPGSFPSLGKEMTSRRFDLLPRIKPEKQVTSTHCLKDSSHHRPCTSKGQTWAQDCRQRRKAVTTARDRDGPSWLGSQTRLCDSDSAAGVAPWILPGAGLLFPIAALEGAWRQFVDGIIRPGEPGCHGLTKAPGTAPRAPAWVSPGHAPVSAWRVQRRRPVSAGPATPGCPGCCPAESGARSLGAAGPGLPVHAPREREPRWEQRVWRCGVSWEPAHQPLRRNNSARGPLLLLA